MRCSASDGSLAVRGERGCAGWFPPSFSFSFPALARTARATTSTTAYTQVVVGNSRKKKSEFYERKTNVDARETECKVFKEQVYTL